MAFKTEIYDEDDDEDHHHKRRCIRDQLYVYNLCCTRLKDYIPFQYLWYSSTIFQRETLLAGIALLNQHNQHHTNL